MDKVFSGSNQGPVPTSSDNPAYPTFTYGPQKPMSAFHSIESLMTPSGHSAAIGQWDRMGGAPLEYQQTILSSYNRNQPSYQQLWQNSWSSPYNMNTIPRSSSEENNGAPTNAEASLRGNSEVQRSQYHSQHNQPPVSDLSLNPFQYETPSSYRIRPIGSQEAVSQFSSKDSFEEKELTDEILDVGSYSPCGGSGGSPREHDGVNETNQGPCSSSSTGYSSGYQSCEGSAESPIYRTVPSYPLSSQNSPASSVASLSEPAHNMPSCPKSTSIRTSYQGKENSPTSFQKSAPVFSPSHSAINPFSETSAAYLHQISAASPFSQPASTKVSFPEQAMSMPPLSESSHQVASFSGMVHGPPSFSETASSINVGPQTTLTQSDTTPAPAQETTSISALAQEPAPTKKPRIKYTPAQLQTLEDFFRETPYPDWDELEELSKKLDIAEQKIKVWFQNKRARWRKKNAAIEKAETPAPRLTQLSAVYGPTRAFPGMTYPPSENQPAPFYNRSMYNMW